MAKRLSLYGVDPVEALRAALNTPPPKKRTVKKRAKNKKPPKSTGK